MPWVRDKILIDCSRIEAEMEIGEQLSAEIEQMGLLTTPDAKDFKERYGRACEPFLKAVREINDEMAEYINKHFEDKKQ